MKKLSRFVRALIFLLILGFLSVNVFRVLSWKDTKGITGLYQLPTSCVDVLFLGSSHSFCSVNTAQLWNDYGIAANDISEASQKLINEAHYLKEALNLSIRPKVVFAEIYGAGSPNDYSEGNMYRNTLNMKWSPNYFSNADAALARGRAYMEEQSELYRKRIYLKFPVVHSRYRELSETDFVDDSSRLRFSENWSKKSYDAPEALKCTDVAELREDDLQALDQMLHLSKEYGFQLVLWAAPFNCTKKEMRIFNAIEKYAGENGIKCYNIPQMVEGSGFDFSTDLRKERFDGTHMNVSGSTKVTNYLGQILQTEFEIKSRKGDPQYKWYDEAAKEWDVASATHDLSQADTLQVFLDSLDPELFDATVIDCGVYSDTNLEKPSEDSQNGRNLIKNPDSFKDWWFSNPRLTTVSGSGTLTLSASGLTELAYARAEGTLTVGREDLLSGDEYVLSFEVMSPDWSAVSEPSMKYTGLDAVAIIFATMDEPHSKKTQACQVYRLGRASSSIWREVPDAVDGQWLKYVSVPIKFTSEKSEWKYFERGIGPYMRVGPELRANGTVSFRNIKLENTNQSNDRGVALQEMLGQLNVVKTSVPGLYTNGIQSRVNGSWELSKDVRLVIDEENPAQFTLYNNTEPVKTKEGDIFIVVTDKENGELIAANSFN